MTGTREFFTFLSCAAMIVSYHCSPDTLPPPSGLVKLPLGRFTVGVYWAWQKPDTLPKDCKVEYEVAGKLDPVRWEQKNFNHSFLNDKMASDNWTYTIRTVSEQCDGWKDSEPVHISITCAKKQAKLVEDLICVLDSKGMNCSWTPINASLNLRMSYSLCGAPEADLKELNQTDRSGGRKGLFLKYDRTDICFLVDSEIGWSYLRPALVIPLPKLNITADKGQLKLNWQSPEVGKECIWKYMFRYTQCSEPIENSEFMEVTSLKEQPPAIAYDENCRYELEYRVWTDPTYCPTVKSEGSATVAYGTNKARDGTLTVVAIVIPLILFVSVMLSCYCFRKHRDIICPNIPDPSAIFKEMMMNGNKDFKPTAGNLYTPVPEPVESCRITLASEHSVPQQNS